MTQKSMPSAEPFLSLLTTPYLRRFPRHSCPPLFVTRRPRVSARSRLDRRVHFPLSLPADLIGGSSGRGRGAQAPGMSSPLAGFAALRRRMTKKEVSPARIPWRTWKGRPPVDLSFVIRRTSPSRHPPARPVGPFPPLVTRRPRVSARGRLDRRVQRAGKGASSVGNVVTAGWIRRSPAANDAEGRGGDS